jgi:cobyric acid synthase CobQ
MLQGTTSNAGKSVLATAFARILLQDGVRVAPFKAQNMSLNSFVTRDGGEMGRAQVVQARACRLDPDVRMNPVLLKPSSDTGSQVIVLGRPVGQMNVRAYTRFKKSLVATVRQTYDELAAEYDAMILEGAGSPAEINLKSHDIVNMSMAHHAHAAVLLAGDIDRGGVYAHFLGTMACLDAAERRWVKGFLVNRFRGDARLLKPAHAFVWRRTRRPVVGVVPYLPDLNLPEEDSVSFKCGDAGSVARRHDAVDVAVIDLPHISNFTDFDALRIEPDVRLRFVRSAAALGTPDAIIVPGSKNVPGDLRALRSSGIAAEVERCARNHRHIVGICGGFQMLGREIADPHRLESSDGASLPGLCLLDVRTILERDKTLARTEGVDTTSGASIHGYEIHHGRTTLGRGLTVWATTRRGKPMISGTSDGRVWGTYVHGLFDADEFRRGFIDRLRVARGLAPLGAVAARYDIEPAIDRLADTVRAAVDMRRIYAWMGL